MKSFGIDISSYQGRSINYDLMKHKTKFVAVRAGISWGFEDPVFAQNWRALKGHNRIAYHVVYPSQDPVRQAEWFLDIVERASVDWKQDRLVLDLELHQSQSRTIITNCTLSMMERLKRATGRYPILYSRASWVNEHMTLDDGRLINADWWVAHYLRANPYPAYTPEHPGPPLLPRGVAHWLIHQTGERGNGSAVGVQSHYVDTDRWNGTESEMQAYFGRSEPPDGPEPPVDEPLYSVKITTTPPNRYITYNAPNGVRWDRDRWLNSGDIVPVWEENGHWLRIDTLPRWINGSYSQWVKRIDDPQPPVTEIMYYGATYWQRDPRWKDIMLGTKSTIGANGCAMTCTANACNALGEVTNPHALNAWLTANAGYANGNLIIWQALEQLYPSIKWDGMVYRPSDDRIKQDIRAGKLPIIVVDFDEATPQEDMHWVTAIGIDGGNNIIIHDPWDNDVVKFRQRYNKPVIRYCTYSKR